MGDKLKSVLAGMIIVMLLPYVLTVLISGSSYPKEATGSEDDLMIDVKIHNTKTKMNLEEYLIGVVAGQIPLDYEEETLKAQAIIARTNLLYQKEQDDAVWFQEAYASMEGMRESLSDETFKEYYEKLKRAIGETKGQVVTYEGDLVELPYHSISAGGTRNGWDAFAKEGYDYLESVECLKDVEALEYLGVRSYSLQEFIDLCKEIDTYGNFEEGTLKEQIQILSEDEQHYVIKIKVGDETVSGEKFRSIFSLNSSCFQIDKVDQTIKITTKGLGHGVGMSQYGANEMAKEGADAIEILQYFFKNSEILKK
ncbi:MAG TPA: SpoIID/LytB domain-containing protein [Candidatus Merdenecus merdavium]|nr:SpoIID/LytB domain-containing protein [Candidatus Merdenecus merdavium]